MNQAVIDCEYQWFYFQGKGVVSPPYLISAVKACRLLKKGCNGFLCSVLDTHDIGVKLEDIPIAKNNSVVYPKELPSLIIEKEAEFGINVI